MFSREPPFDAKLQKTNLLMHLSSILEAFLEPGLLTFCFLIAPKANTCLFFGSQFPCLVLRVKSD